MPKPITLPNPKEEIRQYKRRIIFIIILIGLMMALLMLRLIYLQVIQHKLYSTLSKQNLLSIAPVDPNRGLIYDRNGVLLAANIPVYSLEATPEKIPNLKKTLSELQKIISLSEADIQTFNKQIRQQRRFNRIPLRVKLTEAEIAKFSVNRYRFPGIDIEAHMLRYYPFASLMQPVLGYVGRINAAELGKVDLANYSASNYIGKTGIEKYYEALLHGTVGIKQIEMSANGQIIRSNQSHPAIAGRNLYLTIDSRLQLAAQQALGNKPGAVVALNPQNGEVLALVSNPSFDPNLFVTGISNSDYLALQQNPKHPLYNRAFQGEYPPGSTIKPFFALHGLATKTITPSDKVFDPGWFKLPNSTHIYHDWNRLGHGWVNLEMAIIQSCDTYFFTLARKMGIQAMSDILKQFGFGQITQIDTAGERSGLLPTPEWKQRARHQGWYPGDTIITGIGQGYLLATPLQLATAGMRLVMQGKGYQPHLLLSDTTPDGKTTQNIPAMLPQITIPDNAWNIVMKGMQGVVSNPQGTGFRAGAGASYTFGGKSGTAQVFSLKGNARDKSQLLPEKLRDHSWFLAYAPIEKPKIVLVVFAEHGGEGQGVYIARQILDSYFAKGKT